MSVAAQSSTRRALRVLVLDEEFPYPLNAGKRIRTWNLIRRLSHRHDVTWLCFGPVEAAAAKAATDANIRLESGGTLANKQGLRLYAALLRNCFSPHPYSVDKHHSPTFVRALRRLTAAEEYDLVHCEWTPYARYLAAAPQLPSVISAHNVESQIWSRRAEHSRSPVARWYFGWQARKMQRFERSALAAATRVVTVSGPDLEQFAAQGIGNGTVVDNGVDVEFFQPQPPAVGAQQTLLFLASLDWFPNQDALQYFVAHIFPLIRRQRPETRLRVVGRRAPAALAEQMRGTPGVDMIGEVDDVREQYPQAAVVVVPLRIGGGSRLKILEAMAAGTPVVSTSVGAEGIEVTAGRDIVLADTPEEFSRATLGLMDDAARRASLATNARALVMAKYSWDALARKLEAVWEAAAEVKRP